MAVAGVARTGFGLKSLKNGRLGLVFASPAAIFPVSETVFGDWETVSQCREVVVRGAIFKIAPREMTSEDSNLTFGDSETTIGDSETTSVDAEMTFGEAEATFGDSRMTSVEAETTSADPKITFGDADAPSGDPEATFGDPKGPDAGAD